MIYLDNAATTIEKSPKVIEAVLAAMKNAGNAGRGVHQASLQSARLLMETRSLLAEYMNFPDPERVCFTANATEALNMAVSGAFRPGDHVITTMLEHNSVLRPLYRLQQSGIIELTILRADDKGRICYDELEKAICPKTRAIVMGHASNLTGTVQNLERAGRICKKHDIWLFVDAAQTAGVIPIDMETMNIAVLCITGHKALGGPQGTGAIFVRKDVQLQPLKVGGTGVHSYDREQPEDYPEHLEAGTLNIHGIAGLCQAVRLRMEEAGHRAEGMCKETELARAFFLQVRDIPGVKVYGCWDEPETEHVGIVSLNIEDYDSGQVSDELAERFDIMTRAGAHCAPLCHQALGTIDQGAVRFSFSDRNTVEEVRLAAEAVRILATE